MRFLLNKIIKGSPFSYTIPPSLYHRWQQFLSSSDHHNQTSTEKILVDQIC